MTKDSVQGEVRLEIGSFARFGDIIDGENDVAGKIWIPKGLQESESVDTWIASIDEALATQGFKRTADVDAQLPFTRTSALERHIVGLVSA